MPRPLNRRLFLQSSAVIAAGGSLAGAGAAGASSSHASRRRRTHDSERSDTMNTVEPTFFKAVKFGMVQIEGSIREKFALLREIGFDGVELDSPNDLDRDEIIAASRDTRLPVHGVVDSIHWSVRLSDPDPDVRARAVEGLKTAIRDSHAYGGSSVLLVPGRVTNAESENHDQVWRRSIEGIRHVLPLAAKLGVHILIENVWNGFLYDHDGPSDQSAERFAQYIDEIDSPWVGMYFDLGNHRKYGAVEQWVRTLGRRIVKLDVKDWGFESGWAKIGDGDVNWAGVREALGEIGFDGWATAEVGGGDAKRLREISRRMERVLEGSSSTEAD